MTQFFLASLLSTFLSLSAIAAESIPVTVTNKGFEPNKIAVTKGKPVSLAITRTTDKTCATKVAIPDLNIEKELPLNKTVVLNFTPNKTGELRYGCAMKQMVGGVLTVN